MVFGLFEKKKTPEEQFWERAYLEGLVSEIEKERELEIRGFRKKQLEQVV
jgi:hypothetical protein